MSKTFAKCASPATLHSQVDERDELTRLLSKADVKHFQSPSIFISSRIHCRSRKMPTDWTHDVSRANYRINNLEEFGHQLQLAANAAFPSGGSPYKEVHVLLLSWEDDNLGVIREVVELQRVFQRIYLYDVHEFKIPSNHCFQTLRKKVNIFLEDFERNDSLLIVYYGGRT